MAEWIGEEPLAAIPSSSLPRRPTFILTIDLEIADLDFGVIRSKNVFYMSRVWVKICLFELSLLTSARVVPPPFRLTLDRGE
ncbi:hypothetical protein QR685DRAFT_207222 [Neurospora intermedia]|uniref:Uncharacterized protein n=1 Tax=Neurospora intermedia TaxID=5142 RepID=A0ABR3DFX1_NEUIN